jgi:hypothetical protein
VNYRNNTWKGYLCRSTRSHTRLSRAEKEYLHKYLRAWYKEEPKAKPDPTRLSFLSETA